MKLDCICILIICNVAIFGGRANKKATYCIGIKYLEINVMANSTLSSLLEEDKLVIGTEKKNCIFKNLFSFPEMCTYFQISF